MGCFCSHSQHPTDEIKEQKETNRKINNQLAKDKHEYKSTHRLLLLGKKNLRFLSGGCCMFDDKYTASSKTN